MNSKDKVVLFSYIKPITKKHLIKMSLDTNQPISTCVEAILDAHRLKRDVKLKAKVPKTVQKHRKVQQRKKKKIEKLSNEGSVRTNS
jgi:hypothetical protein